MACIGYDLHSIDIDDEVDGYNAEYIITLYDNEIFCEPMLRENGYLTDDSPVMYILDNCSSKVIPYCKGKAIYEVSVGDDDCSCDECEECLTINGRPATKEEFDNYVSQFKNGEKPTTPSTSSTTYKVNGKEVSKDEFDTAMSEIEDKYLDNVRDMLLGYCDVMDRMNQWRSRLFW